jgi:hypothetical protein
MTNSPAPKTTVPYMIQAGLAFGIALVTIIVGELQLPVTDWARAFLALGTVFLVSSSFTLAKCIRDAQETGNVVNRVDQARLDRLLAEFDPFQVTPMPAPQPPFHPDFNPPYTQSTPMNQAA